MTLVHGAQRWFDVLDNNIEDKKIRNALRKLVANLEQFSIELIDEINSFSSGGAPTTAEYITASSDAGLSAERVLTNTASVTWDFTTPGQAKATAVGGSGLTQPQVMARGLGS